jgi:hypothetical protein
MTLLSPPVQAVLELFQGPLADVRFADVDATGLASVAAEVESAAAAVARQEAQLSELRQSLSERQDALLVLAQRALAYARVYAEHDEALTEKLARISLPRAAKARKASATKSEGGEAVAQAEPAALESSASAAEAPAAAVEVEVEADADADASSAEAPAPALRNGKRRVARTLARHAPSRP